MSVAALDAGGFECSPDGSMVAAELIADRRQGQSGDVEVDGSSDLVFSEWTTTQYNASCLEVLRRSGTSDRELTSKVIDGGTGLVALNQMGSFHLGLSARTFDDLPLSWVYNTGQTEPAVGLQRPNE